jgi:hypothetical protein
VAVSPELTEEVRRTLADLRVTQRAPTAWPAVAGDLPRLAAAAARDDPDAGRAGLVPIAQATFEGKVRGRRAAAGKPAAVVVATKPTPALPVVGGVSAVLLIGIGCLLGGWAVAALTALFAAFVFGVALAGTRTTKVRLERRRAALAPSAEPTEAAPRLVVEAIANVEARLARPPS